MDFSIYLVQADFNRNERYQVSNGKIRENKKSVFDIGVSTKTRLELKNHFVKNKIQAKFLRQSQSNPNVYFRQSKKNETPWWANYWDVAEPLTVSSAAALVILAIGDKRFLISHGFARFYINPYAIVHDFGLKVALNMVDSASIRTANLFTPSEISLRTRKQSGINAKIEQYDIDVFSTLLKSVSGRSRKRYKILSAGIEGMDSLKISHRGSPDFLQRKIALTSKLYSQNKYKEKGFEWIDNFRSVKDLAIKDILDEKLLEAIQNRDTNVSLSFPIVFDETKDVYFSYTGITAKFGRVQSDVLEIDQYYGILDKVGSKVDFEDLKKHRVSVFDFADGAGITSAPVLKCLYFEAKLHGANYFIESGTWYLVSDDFFKKIEKNINPFFKSAHDFGIQYDNKSIGIEAAKQKKRKEFIFNQQLTSHLLKLNDTENLDGITVYIGRSQIEICDVIHKHQNRTWLIHNKYNYGASALSHLFSQAIVSIEALLDSQFRSKANKKIKSSKLKVPSDFSAKRASYTIVLGIILKKNTKGQFDIPLFSKINLERTIKNAQIFGCELIISFIEVV